MKNILLELRMFMIFSAVKLSVVMMHHKAQKTKGILTGIYKLTMYLVPTILPFLFITYISNHAGIR